MTADERRLKRIIRKAVRDLKRATTFTYNVNIIRFRWSDLKDAWIDDPVCPGRKKRITELVVQQGKTGKRIGIEVTTDLEALDQGIPAPAHAQP